MSCGLVRLGLARWLRARLRPRPPAQCRQRRIVIAMDGETLRGAPT
ncbi:hypothetical protein O7626_38715 [Micromonospora sp. WMMD1102]|nr:hypothetical protein [Micromonospora sp. WMMD1102]MDG4791757.1 hypothetical protein [Micromonospora sp. WMMD1102]